MDWLLGLPPKVRPHIIAARFGRIANNLCGVWNDPDACRAYFDDDLLSDRRGGRQGFPLAVGRELMVLRRYYGDLHGERDDQWQDRPGT